MSKQLSQWLFMYETTPILIMEMKQADKQKACWHWHDWAHTQPRHFKWLEELGNQNRLTNSYTGKQVLPSKLMFTTT